MTTYEITYIRTGSGEKKETDKVWLTSLDKIEFTNEIKEVHNIIEAIEVFEMIAAKWWGTYENRNAIVNIKVTEK